LSDGFPGIFQLRIQLVNLRARIFNALCRLLFHFPHLIQKIAFLQGHFFKGRLEIAHALPDPAILFKRLVEGVDQLLDILSSRRLGRFLGSGDIQQFFIFILGLGFIRSKALIRDAHR